MRWPLHEMGKKSFQNLLLDKENSLHMNKGKLWPTCKAWVIWYEVAFTWDWKRISFQNLLVEKDNGFSLQKNLHETRVSLMCHVLWHESIWYIKVTGTIWRKILSIYKKNLSIRVAALLALSVILRISDLLLFPYWERFWWNQNQSLAGLKRYTTEIFLIPSGHFPCHIVELSDHVAKKEIAFFK